MSGSGWGRWGTWEEAEACIGQVIGRSTGPDPCERGSIRRWLESKEFDAPIHQDREAARAAGYSDIVAPATMVFSYGIAPYWQPGDAPATINDQPAQIQIPVIFNVPAPCDRSFATSIEVEFFNHLYPGDEVSCTSRLVSIQRKTLKVGEGGFFRQEDTYTRQGGDVIAVALVDIFRFVSANEEAGQ